MKVCEIEGCERPVRTAAASWCHMHYTRWWRHGDPKAVVSPESRRQPNRPTDPADVRRLDDHCELSIYRRDGSVHTVLYDQADAELVEAHRWHVFECTTVPGLFYARTNGAVNGRKHLGMHNLLIGRALIDHINHNGLDNRRANLRPASTGQNSANSRPRTGGTSKFKGVYLVTRLNRWASRIRGKHLGYFDDEVEAAKAYDAAAVEEFGEFAYLNFPVRERWLGHRDLCPVQWQQPCDCDPSNLIYLGEAEDQGED